MKVTALLILIFSMLSNYPAHSQDTPDHHLLIGTYSTDSNPNGIHVYRFNVQTADFQPVQPVTPLPNASFLTISQDRKNVYAVSEGREGSVNAYAFNPVTGKLDFLNSVPAPGPCYVSVDKTKKLVFVGNYGGGSVQAVPLSEDGALITDNVQTIQHEGGSVVENRQDKPHVHAAVLSADDQYLMVPDLGTDKVYQYQIDASRPDILEPAATPFMQVAPGGGPRHLAFHPNGRFAYLVLELEAAVAALEYHKAEGRLELIHTISMTAADFQGGVSGADIHVSPDGKFLYASNRGDANEIAIFAIDHQGQLTMVGRQSVLGKTPRNFAIDPTGNFLLAANQNTNEIVIFKRDSGTGLLTDTGKRIRVDKPVCLKFTAIGN
jgi:6-phosphogluconolactonase